MNKKLEDLNNIELILLDLDETIYDQRHASRSGLKAVAERFPLFKSHSIENLENIYFAELHKIHLKVIDGLISSEEAHEIRFQKIIDHFKIKHSPSEISSMIETYDATSKKSKRAIPGTKEVVEALGQKFKIGILTNGPTEHQKEKAKLCKIDHLVDFIVVSEETGHRKPAPEIFDICLHKGNTKPERCLMVGDSWDSDITGALNKGIHPIWVNRGRHENYNSKEVIEVQHIKELDILLRSNRAKQ